MRIIAGEFKGRRLKTPPKQWRHVRPIQDKIKGAIFNILQERVWGARVLDLFAGSGSFGIEALSRGAGHVTFVESDRELTGILKENLRLLGVYDRAAVLQDDALDSIQDLAAGQKMFDLVFSDPPYRQGLAKMSLLKAAECAIVAKSGFWITEIHKKEDLPEVAGGLVFWSRRLYGGTAVSFYRRA